jgi:hypothetical protein
VGCDDAGVGGVGCMDGICFLGMKGLNYALSRKGIGNVFPGGGIAFCNVDVL